MAKRDMLPKSNVEVIEAEVVEDYREPQNNKPAIANKVAEALPDIIQLARDVVALKAIDKKTQLEMARLQQQTESLKVEAESFVKKEQERRATIQAKGQQAVSILAELTKVMQVANIEPAVQHELINSYNLAIQQVCRDNC